MSRSRFSMILFSCGIDFDPIRSPIYDPSVAKSEKLSFLFFFAYVRVLFARTLILLPARIFLTPNERKVTHFPLFTYTTYMRIKEKTICKNL